MLRKLFRLDNVSSSGSRTKIRIHWLGANRSVTGSMHLLELEESGKVTRILVDAGMFQGAEESLNYERRLPKGLKAKDIDVIVFTHAHLDHIGYYPKLWRDGFRGVGYATKPTLDLMGLSLPDSGRIQKENADELQRSKKQHPGPSGPLYTLQDGVECLKLVQAKDFYQTFSPTRNVTVQFLPASHLIGAAIVVLELGTGSGKRRIVFSGDIGRKGTPCLRDVARVKNADFIVCESTKGEQLNSDRDPKTALAEAINAGIKLAHKKSHPVQGPGKIIIPVFNTRAPSILYQLRALVQERRIPNIPVFVDGMGVIKTLKVHRDHANTYPEADQRLAKRTDLFSTPRSAEVMMYADSLRLDKPAREPTIIVSSSGMATAGRVLRHLKAALQHARNTIVFVGHQADGTNGALLTAGDAKSICIDEQKVKVRAKIELVREFSGHGDWRDLLNWLSGFKRKPRKLFLVHGEEESATALKARVEKLLGWNVAIPKYRTCTELV